MKLYNRVFYEPLYKTGYALKTTQSALADGNRDVRQPLLYSLSLTRGYQLRTVTLAFFDTAGEDLSDKTSDFDVIESMAKINRYIYNAAGIILLVDPLRIPEIRKKVELAGISGMMSDRGNTAAGNIITRTSELIYRGQNLPRTKKIPIPLAVVFSKMDLLKKSILGAEAAVYQQSRHRGFFSIADFQNNHDCIRDWIDEYDKQLMQVTPLFKDAAFFGVSALGGNPDENSKLPFSSPHPIRVEDPFLWLLWKNGIVAGK